ncbi:MAG: hypothetical protein KDB69_09820, partial [Acidimicrobiia bacterium]|nr:hypothetical protein [Acidimicrobiia bacterium]
MRIKLAILTALAAVFFVCPTAVAAEAPAEVHTGVYSDDFDSSGDLNGISAAAGQRVTFAGTFHDAYEASPSYDPTDVNSWSNTVGILEGVWAGKATPFANFDIKASAASIAAGNHDTQIAQWVRHVKAWLARGGGRSLIVAPFQEHNGKWTPYGCNPTAFRTAYAKVVDAFHAAGVGETKVRFAWAPNGWTSPGCGSLADYYPGDDLVDVVSVSGYNWVACPGSLGYETPAQAIGTWFDEIRTTLPGTYVKPFLVAQTASPNSGCQAHWMTSLVNFLDADPNAVGFVWFNFNKPGEPDFRVWAGTLAQGWKDAVATGTTAYRWPLASWFAPGPLVAVGATPPPPPCVKAPCDTIAAVDAGSRFGVWDALDYPHLKNWFYFGNPGDLPFMGDWDGDGEATPGLYRQSDGFVYVRDTNTQ